MSGVGIDDAVVATVARRGSIRFGRTKLMKCLYFLREVGGMELDSEFELYTWGPFSKDVLSSLGALIEKGELVESAPNGDEGYDITLAADIVPPKVLSGSQTELLDALVSQSAQSLEALSTLHFIAKRTKNVDRDEVVNRVKRIKPYFRVSELENYWEQLSTRGWLPEPT